MTIRGEFLSKVELPDVEVFYGIHTTDMVYVATMGTAHLSGEAAIRIGHNSVECHVAALPLVPGTYAIRVGVMDCLRQQLFYGETLLVFTISPRDIPVSRMSALGIVDIPARWTFDTPVCESQ